MDETAATPEAILNRFPVWYHTLELGNGVVTPGFFDHRPHLDRFPLPRDLSGARCLDVGTMDGFWAFEMERRGASEVIGIDLDDPDALDWPVRVKPTVVKTLDETKVARFEAVRSLFGSNVQRIVRSVYDLDVDMGKFDVVFCGDLLIHLKNPIGALEALLRVTSGQAIVYTQVIKESFMARHRPFILFDGISEFTWWLPTITALVRMMSAAGFEQVKAEPILDIPLTAPKTRGYRGIISGRPA